MKQHSCVRRGVLMVATSVLALGSSHGAWAQEAAPSADPSAEDIIVTGIRASQERAVNIKRNATSVVDSISAEDIGKLPDVTISDSLQRIPGVQILRSAGEGS